MHERGLACAVLAQERVKLAWHQREIGPAQCLHGAELFPNPAELEGGRGNVHSPVGWSWNSHSSPKRSAMCDARACTPSVSVA